METKLLLLKCPECDAELSVKDNLDMFYCTHCGRKIILDDEKRREALLSREKMEHETRLHTWKLNQQAAIRREELQHEAREKQKSRDTMWKIVILVIVLIFIPTAIVLAAKYTGFGYYINRAEKFIDSQMGLAQVPGTSESYVDKPVRDARISLENAGFTDIEEQPAKDLFLGILKKEGDVAHISINGETDFKSGAKFPKTAKVIIYYHSYREE